MLIKKGDRANMELEINMERQLFAQAERCKGALENRRMLLEQVHAKNVESLERHQAKLLERIGRLECRLEENEAAMRKRVASCRRTLQEDVKRQLEIALQRSEERIEANITVDDEIGMTKLLRKEAADFSRNAYQLINASLDPLVEEINGGVSIDEIELETLALPQAVNYQDLCTDQDTMTIQLREELNTLQASQADLAQALEERVGSPEYLQLQQEVQELQIALAEAQKECADLPPYVPHMVEVEDGRMQPSQIARSIGAVADWAMLLIPGANIEAAITKFAQIPKVAKAMGKCVGILEKVGKAAKQGDAIKDILFSLKNLSERTRTSRRREKLAGEAIIGIAKNADACIEAQRKKSNDGDSILDLLTVEHWAGKLGAKFDRPPRLVVDKEYEARYKAAKNEVETECREVQQKAYQKKLEMGLLQKEEERLRAKEESLRVDEAAVSKELVRREAELRAEARREALKKWRRDCAIWYQNEVERYLQAVIESYTESFPTRLEEYQRQRLRALRDAVEQEQRSYEAIKNAPEDEIALELQRVNELLECIDNVFHG